MNRGLPKIGRRTPEQIREHYEIEKELASRLRSGTKEERRHLYSSLYDELFRRVPHHPQLTSKASPSERAQAVRSESKFLTRFSNRDTTFLEVGPGDCALSFEVARFVERVYAVDVSDAITRTSTSPENFQLILSDGCSIPVPQGTVDVAYSNQLMEHLHSEDAYEQLRSIFSALADGGSYVCITPNALSGPHDVSMYFDAVPTGFHLKEYTFSELNALFTEVGFSKVVAYVGAKGVYAALPVAGLVLCEKALCKLPFSFGGVLARILPVRVLLTVRLVGTK